VVREKEDVAPEGAEGRKREDDDGEPVIEVLAEPPRAHGLGQVQVARRDNPDGDWLTPRAAEAPYHAILDRGEELRLQRLGEERDLVEEERALVGRLEEPGLGLAGVCEGAALEAEELGFQQGLRDRRAVHGDERPAAPAGLVKLAGEKAFASARLTLDQDRRPSARGYQRQQPLDLGSESGKLRTVPEELGKDRALGP
jgi:hypothetical protein